MGDIKIRAAILIAIIAFQPFSAAAHTQDEKKAKIKKQLVIIPVGTTIEVKRLREGSGKITGKLLSISDESFEIRRDIGASVFYEKIAFADVKSVKKGSAEVKWVKDGSGREKTLVGVVSVIVFVAAAAAQICQNGKCF